MTENDMNSPLEKVRRRLKALESSIENEPVVLLSGDGGQWLSEGASKIIKKNNVKMDSFLSRLKWEQSHLSSACCCGIETVIMRLPGSKDFLVILRDDCQKIEGLDLTCKERLVLDCVMRGRTNKMIAQHLGISPGTVNSHLDSIYRKLGVSNRMEATYMALRKGYMPKDIGTK